MASNQFIIAVASKDRVGIVADVTNAILRLGGNLEDLSQSVMRGHFSMILLASMPIMQDTEELKRKLHEFDFLSDCEITIFPYQEADEEQNLQMVGDNTYVLTASGNDRPGLVAAMADFLRSRKINIIDLSTRHDAGVYTMLFLVNLPENTAIAALKDELAEKMRPFGLSIGLRQQALFRAVNEI